MNQANKKALISYYYEGLSLEHAIEIIEHGGYTKIDQATIKAACNTIKNCTGIDWTTVKEYHDPYTEQLDAYLWTVKTNKKGTSYQTYGVPYIVKIAYSKMVSGCIM